MRILVKDPDIKLTKNYWNEFLRDNFGSILEDANRTFIKAQMLRLYRFFMYSWK
jgi:hypothetical protein